jgi:two-component system KDP operon response regulator KdpE
VPVIVLSARTDSVDKVEALDEGADDYVTKPFAMEELLARVRVALRRDRETADAALPPFRTARFTLDFDERRAVVGGAEVRLTPTEWRLLEVLAREPGHLVQHQELLREVWGPRYGRESNYLRVYANQLRRKLEPDPARPRYLLTDPGQGYRLTGDPPAG